MTQMLNKLSGFFKGNKESAEQMYLQENNIEFYAEQGYIVDGIVVNSLLERLEYLVVF